jgi:endonuclease YncB( thermonuclease family)
MVAAEMRAGVERLAAESVRSRPPRFWMFRLFRLLLLILAAVAAILYLAGTFDFDRVVHRHGTRIAPGDFTLCSHANRTNCVVDGDTIRYNGTIIRIEGIDAPETHRAKCESEKALGMRATRRLLELVNLGPFEIVHKGKRDTDKYGRKLRVLERNGRSFGDILIAEGLARRWEGRQRSWCRGKA